LRQANQYAEGGQWDQAVAAYQEAQRKAPFDEHIRRQLDRAKSSAAAGHYAQGKRALDERRLPEALHDLKLALGLDPSKAEHHAALADVFRLKDSQAQLQAAQKLQHLGRMEEALSAFERAVELDPTQTTALDRITELTKQQRAAKTIGGSQEPLTLRFQNAKLKEVFEILARTAGVNVLFDKEVRDEPITIFIKDLPFDEALQLILHTNGLITQQVAPDTILIMPNNKQKQAQYQDLLMRTFYLANAKAKDAVNLVRTMLDSKKIYVDEKVNAIVVRDEPAKLQLTEKLLFAIDRREPEVELDVEVLEVNRTKSMKYGINFAKQAGFGIRPGTGTGGISTAPTLFTLEQLTALSPQSYLFTIPASMLTDFFKQQSDAKTLASPKLRVLNNRSASINVGDKQPILLSTTNVLPGQAATGAIPTTSTVTSIEFKDVGVKLTVEPSINALDEIAMKLKIEVTRLGDQVILQASPEIKQFKFGTRMAETFLMMRDDETVVLAGLIQGEDRKNRSSVPLLGDIPYVGELLSATTVDRVETEVVLTITPRVVRSLTTPPIADQAFWSGTDQNYATTQLFPPRARTVSQTTPAGSPTTGKSGPPTAPSSSVGAAETKVPLPIAPAPSAPQTGVPTASSGASGSSPTPDLVARGPGLFTLSPSDLSAAVGQEFRVDLSTLASEAVTESLVTVSYDPALVEFRRVGPGAAAISARATDGQVLLTVRRQGAGGIGDSVLAMLFFQAKVKGDTTLTLETVPSDGGAPPRTERAVIHVQ
jgi:general secretion pathway protein D